MENEKKEFKFEDLTTLQKVAIGGTAALGILASFKLGYKWSCYKSDLGLEAMFKDDPTFKEHFVKVITENQAKKLMEN